MGEDKKGKFKDLVSISELKSYLDKKPNNLHNTEGKELKYMCQYTNINAAVSIIKDGFWYIGSPKKMNDGLEISHGANNAWDNIFFSSFMYEPKESIAMWSMYAQPWSDGVMIRIPLKVIKEWIKSSPHVCSADPDTKKANDDDITDNVRVSLHAIAYSNTDSKGKDESEYLICGEQKNEKILNVTNSPNLVGYVKDVAWSYEREYRLRVDNISNQKYDAIAIKLTDEVINSIEIVAGPRFSGVLSERIESNILSRMRKDKLKKSLFTNKLKSTYCDRCAVEGKYDSLWKKVNHLVEIGVLSKSEFIKLSNP